MSLGLRVDACDAERDQHHNPKCRADWVATAHWVAFERVATRSLPCSSPLGWPMAENMC
jgi:hypothetical protein